VNESGVEAMDKYVEHEKPFLRKERLGEFGVGDTVDVSVMIREGDKERIQVFSGTVIARRGTGLGESFTVRRIVQGEGVERIFPVHSPKVVKVDVKTRARVRRAKLYYLRSRQGKATRLKERMGGREDKG
jgi:large subunit ribosomal protein L19